MDSGVPQKTRHSAGGSRRYLDPRNDFAGAGSSPEPTRHEGLIRDAGIGGIGYRFTQETPAMATCDREQAGARRYRVAAPTSRRISLRVASILSRPAEGPRRIRSAFRCRSPSVRKGSEWGGFIAGPEPATIQPSELQAIPAVVVDLALSRNHGQGHIPGAWFAIRSRLAEALEKLPAEGQLVLTSEDGAIARFAAAELRTRRPVSVLAGGTAAWKAAGLPLETGIGPLASEPDDVSISARDRPAERERYMRQYLGRSTSSTRSPATPTAASASHRRSDALN
jgi:rhodanese-related sulfurtransferase